MLELCMTVRVCVVVCVFVYLRSCTCAQVLCTCVHTLYLYAHVCTCNLCVCVLVACCLVVYWTLEAEDVFGCVTIHVNNSHPREHEKPFVFAFYREDSLSVYLNLFSQQARSSGTCLWSQIWRGPMISTRVTTKSRPELDKAVPTVPTPFSLKQEPGLLFVSRGKCYITTGASSCQTFSWGVGGIYQRSTLLKLTQCKVKDFTSPRKWAELCLHK